MGALTALLRPYLLRRTKEDVDLGLTPMQETLIRVDITNFQKARPHPRPHPRPTRSADPTFNTLH